MAQGGKQSSEKQFIRRLLTSVSVEGETGIIGFLFRVFVPIGFCSAFQNCSALLRSGFNLLAKLITVFFTISLALPSTVLLAGKFSLKESIWAVC